MSDYFNDRPLFNFFHERVGSMSKTGEIRDAIGMIKTNDKRDAFGCLSPLRIDTGKFAGDTTWMNTIDRLNHDGVVVDLDHGNRTDVQLGGSLEILKPMMLSGKD